jgi:hypothetical protein
MPFTLSHPVAVLPLRGPMGRFAVLPALVVGSMAPDLPYYLGGVVPRDVTHTLASVLWFSLPAGWLAYLVFQHVLRRPAVFLLPAPLRRRLRPEGRVENALAVSLSLVVGATTHVLWDAFTHESGAFVTAFSPLREVWLTVSGHPVWSYKVLQHGSTLLGAGVLAAGVLTWLGRTPPLPREAAGDEGPRWLRIVGRIAASCAPTGVGLVVGMVMSPPGASPASLAAFLVHVVVAALTTLVLVLAALSLLLRPAPAEPVLAAMARGRTRETTG